MSAYDSAFSTRAVGQPAHARMPAVVSGPQLHDAVVKSKLVAFVRVIIRAHILGLASAVASKWAHIMIAQQQRSRSAAFVALFHGVRGLVAPSDSETREARSNGQRACGTPRGVNPQSRQTGIRIVCTRIMAARLSMLLSAYSMSRRWHLMR